MSAIEILKEMIGDYELLGLTAGINNKKKLYDADVKRINALKKALLALEKQEKQLYCAYEQGYEGLDFYGFFSSDKEALIGLKKEIKNSYTCDSEYRFFKLDFSKEGISTSLPVKEVLGGLK